MAILAHIRNSYGVKVLLSSVMTNFVIFSGPIANIVPTAQAGNRFSGSASAYSGNNHEANDAGDHLTVVPNGSGTLKTPDYEAALGQLEYAAVEKYGIIGKARENDDDPGYDNFFQVALPETIDPGSYSAILQYELFGVSSADQTTKSINGNTAYGGQLIVEQDKWASVEEELSSSQLRPGVNEIFFNRRADATYQYQVRNVKIALKRRSGAVVQFSQKVIENRGGKIQLSGFVSDKSVRTLKILNTAVDVADGFFEASFASVSEGLSRLSVSYLKDSKIETVDIPVRKAKAKTTFDFSGADDSEVWNAMDLASGSAGFHSISLFSAKTSAPKNISVRAKHFKDIRPMDAGITNVTAGAYAGYEVRLQTSADSVPTQIGLEYDLAKLPEGYTAKDVRTFFYDKGSRTWKALEVDSLDTQKSKVISTSFKSETDYINGVLTVPESPEVGSFAPTTMSEMAYADPTAGIVGIAPPSPNSQGTANTSFPLKLPKGRNGMQPSLSVNYNSENPNGLMGIGWNLATPAITLNTKFGVPRFEAGKESEMYLMNGAELVLKNGSEYTSPHRTDNISRVSERQFYERKEGAYNKIIRHGDSPENYYWEVTDKSGNKMFFGGYTAVDNNAVIRTDANKIAHWAITRMQDPYGNYVEYTYVKSDVTLATGVTAKKFNIQNINYTRFGSETNYYSVSFLRNSYSLGATSSTIIGRDDVVLTARNGYLSIVDDYLTEIRVTFKQGNTTSKIRGYKFEYDPAPFGKRQLARISEYDTNTPEKLFYTHSLEYYDDIQSSPIINNTAVSWQGDSDVITSPLADLAGSNGSNLPNGSPLGTSMTTGFSAGLRIGFGLGGDIKSAGMTIGGSGNYAVNNTDTRVSFVDINGDGLPDKVIRSGNDVYYRKNTGLGFGGLKQLTGLGNLSKTKSRTAGYGVDANLVYIGIGKSWSKTRSETGDYFTDFNGDGLADVITGSLVKFNSTQEESPSIYSPGQFDNRYFVGNAVNTPNPIISGPISPDVIQDMSLEGMDELREENPQFDHVKVWRAPYQGVVNIEGSARLLQLNSYQGKTNAFKVKIERGGASQTTGNATTVFAPSGNLALNVDKQMQISGVSVNVGDLLFFRIQNLDYGFGGEVEWNPKVTYTTLTSFNNVSNLTTPVPTNDENGRSYRVYDSKEDFMLNNNGGVSLTGTANSLKPIFNLPSFPFGFEGNLRFYIKKTRTNLNTGDENTLQTWERRYVQGTGYVGSAITFSAQVPLTGYVDNYYFYVESDANVNWNLINWQPQYELNGELKYAPADYHTFDSNPNGNRYWIQASELPTPIITNTPSIPNDAQSNFLEMYHTFPGDYTSFLGDINLSHFPMRATWTIKIKGSNGTLILHTRDFWIHKVGANGYAIKETSDPSSSSISATDGLHDDYYRYIFTKQQIKDIQDNNQTVYAALYYSSAQLANPDNNSFIRIRLDSSQANSGYSFPAVTMTKPFLVHKPEFFGITYRGWGQFLYNGGVEFNRNNEGDIVGTSPAHNYGNENIDMHAFDYSGQQSQVQGMNDQMSADSIASSSNAVRYTFYRQENPNQKFKNEAIIYDANDQVAEYGYNGTKITAKLGRFGEYNLYPLYVDPAEIALGGSTVFAGMKQRSESKGSAISGNIGSGSASVAGTKSKATSKVLNQFLDMNGDRYPDLVTSGRIQYTGMLGGMSPLVKTNDFSCGEDSEDSTEGITIPISPNSTKSDNRNTTGNKVSTNTSSGINAGGGRSYNSRQYADMNGDGLPDQVRLVESKVMVKLNTGYDFTAEMEWGTNSNANTSKRSNIGAGVTFSFSSSLALGLGIGTGTATMQTLLIDLNGDGLPDLLNGDGSYKLNTGKAFTATTSTFYSGIDYEYDQSMSGNVFGTFTYGFPITIFTIVFKFVFTISAGLNANYNEKLKTLADIDGDGFVDVLGKSSNVNNTNVTAQLSRVGKTHLLKKFNHALGGSWTIDYTRGGNTYYMPQSKWMLTKIETNDGFSDDNAFKPDNTLATASYEEPRHDRREREFLGYAKVTVEEKDPANSQTYRKSISYYDTRNVYLSGTLKATELYGQTGQLLTKSTTLYNLLDPDAPSVNLMAVPFYHNLQQSLTQNAAALVDKSRLFVAPVRITSTSYEGSQSVTATKEFLSYDSFGNLKKFVDYGTGGDDAYRTDINYATIALENAVSLPSKVVVSKFSNGEILRQREATYDSAKGKLQELVTKLNSTDDNHYGFIYDSYGNISKVKDMDRTDSTGSSSFLTELTYDAVVHIYPTLVSNSYGESSSAQYEYLFGTNIKTTDSNGQVMRTRIDNRGRVLEVTGPNEYVLETPTGGVKAWTIRMQYEGETTLSFATPASTPDMINAQGSFTGSTNRTHYAVTRHYDSAVNQLLTVNIVDGLGQSIQVKKTHKSGSTIRWQVSYEGKDAFGRKTRSYLPGVIAYATAPTGTLTDANDIGFTATPLTPLLTPTVSTFDERDRVTSITQSGNMSSAQIQYSIEGNLMRQRSVNELSQTQDVYTDVRGRQRKTVQNDLITTLFDYDAINELVSVTDNSGFTSGYKYDMGGRKTEVQHPDRGVLTFQYDKASRLVKQSTSNLLTSGLDPIEHKYHYGRLVETKYPDNAQNNVKYTYGAPGDAHAINMNAVGRLLFQEDATGVQAFGYGLMGEMTRQLRSVAVAGYQSYWFLTTWKYDSWNRIKEIGYPDGEVVKYGYGNGGSLEKITNVVPGVTNPADIVTVISYTDYGERASIDYGNGTRTRYEYQSDARRRLSKLTFSNWISPSAGFAQVKLYNYDDLSNIKKIETDQPANNFPASGRLGGPVNHEYKYDAFNRLTHAEGNYIGANDGAANVFLKQSYSLDMEYNPDHTIKRKTQVQTQGTVTSITGTVSAVNPVIKNSYDISYSGYATGSYSAGPSNYGYQQPHAVRTIKESPSWVTNPAADDPRVHYKKVAYDANGNQSEISETLGSKTYKLRRNLWDEENRLKAVDLKPDEKSMHPIAIYTYNASGERTVRYNLDRLDISSNDAKVGSASKDNIMLYPNGLFMAKVYKKDGDNSRNRVLTYTKYYYIGSERVVAKVGHMTNLGHYPKKISAMATAMGTLPESFVKNASETRVTAAQGAISKVYTAFDLPQPSFAPVTQADINDENYIASVKDYEVYTFHSDHLGSSSFVTNASRAVCQHMEYLPFGETMVDEHLNSINSPYKYNGKEYDAETGNYYYGARYYDPKWSVWTSVDPMAEKYLDRSGYEYCFGNPIKLIDPDGKEPSDWVKSGNRWIYRSDITSEAQAKKAGYSGYSNGVADNTYKAAGGVVTLMEGGKWSNSTTNKISQAPDEKPLKQVSNVFKGLTEINSKIGDNIQGLQAIGVSGKLVEKIGNTSGHVGTALNLTQTGLDYANKEIGGDVATIRGGGILAESLLSSAVGAEVGGYVGSVFPGAGTAAGAAAGAVTAGGVHAGSLTIEKAYLKFKSDFKQSANHFQNNLLSAIGNMH